MAFNHRKLLEDFGKCESFCDPEKNPCSDVCNHLCSSICHTTLNGIPQSPEISVFVPLGDYDHHPNKPHKLSLSLTIFVSLVATAFLLFCCYTVYKLYTAWNLNRARARGAHRDEEERINDHDDLLDEDHGPVVDHPIWHIRTVGLQPSVISAITVCKYQRGDGLVEGTDCSVCLTEFQEDETLRLLPKCSHAFHIPCIDTWLSSHTNCPVCRAGIIFNTDSLPSRDQGGGNSAEVEGNQVGASEEIGREREDEVSEIGMNIEEEGQLDVGNGFKSIQEVQPMRRSVSMDSLAVGNSDGQLVKESKPVSVSKRVAVNQSLLRLVGSSSIGRSFQRGHTSIRRSFSYSGKVLQSRHP